MKFWLLCNVIYWYVVYRNNPITFETFRWYHYWFRFTVWLPATLFTLLKSEGPTDGR